MRISEKEQDKKQRAEQGKCGCGCQFSTEGVPKTVASEDKESE